VIDLRSDNGSVTIISAGLIRASSAVCRPGSGASTNRLERSTK
jgi:hypothetical protein